MNILTREEVAKRFKMSRATLDYLVATNQIPFSRVSKRMVRFDEDRLMEWFRGREGVEYHRGGSKN